MKVKNKPVKVLSIFSTDGKIEPVKFVFDDKVVRIEKILKTYEENFVGNKRLIFTCQHSGSFIYELKYEIESGIWYFFQK
jgi:hypothetical protein